jgi:hypothetical protein
MSSQSTLVSRPFPGRAATPATGRRRVERQLVLIVRRAEQPSAPIWHADVVDRVLRRRSQVTLDAADPRRRAAHEDASLSADRRRPGSQS